MPNRSDILKKVTKAARDQGMTFAILREGANHTIYTLDGLMIPVGRHTEFSNRNAETIYKECEAKQGKDWWR